MAVDWNNILVCCCYLSPNLPRAELEGILDDLLNKLQRTNYQGKLILGDFNAKSPLWGSIRKNTRGNLIEEWASSLNLILLNEGNEDTCVRSQGASIVDLTWCSHSLMGKIYDWRVDRWTESLSDHRYITMSYDEEGSGVDSMSVIRGSPRDLLPGWKKDSLKGNLFLACLNNDVWREDSIINNMELEDAVNWLHGTIQRACDASMRRENISCRKRRSTYWWNDKIQSLRVECNKLKKALTINLRKRNVDERKVRKLTDLYKEKRGKLRLGIRKSKESCWENLLETVQNDVWGKPYAIVMGKLQGGTNATADLPMVKVRQIINCLFPRRQLDNGSNSDMMFRVIEDNQMRMEICKVSLEELNWVINDLPSVEKATGPDGIIGFIWMKALPILGPVIREIFTKCLSLGIFPDKWKLARLVLISKPDKLIGDPSAYRPLCMLDEIGKLLERIIVKRMQIHMSDNEVLSDRQFGFRAGKSTVEAIAAVRSRIESITGNKRFAIGIALDIKKCIWISTMA